MGYHRVKVLRWRSTSSGKMSSKYWGGRPEAQGKEGAIRITVHQVETRMPGSPQFPPLWNGNNTHFITNAPWRLFEIAVSIIITESNNTVIGGVLLVHPNTCLVSTRNQGADWTPWQASPPRKLWEDTQGGRWVDSGHQAERHRMRSLDHTQDQTIYFILSQLAMATMERWHQWGETGL